MRVRKTILRKNSQLYEYFNQGDFLDCYTVDDAPKNLPIEEIAQRVFLNLPWWVNLLLVIRDFGAALFGLKATAKLPKDTTFRSSLRVGEPVNFLCVRAIYNDEIILGEDDNHLDFKISVSRNDRSSGEISLATLVRPHNLLGRVYLHLIYPFHVLIVRSSLKRLAAQK